MDEIKNPVKAIRAKCLDCCCGQYSEVEKCTAHTCPLYPFRFGKNPHRQSRQISEERKIEMVERLKKAREAKNVIAETKAD